MAAAFGSLASAQSGEEMLRACEKLHRGMHLSGEIIYFRSTRENYQCWGFMSAVEQYATLADQNGKALLDSCPGPNVTLAQIIRVFTDYARAHPEKLHLKAAAVAYSAMADAFPCK